MSWMTCADTNEDENNTDEIMMMKKNKMLRMLNIEKGDIVVDMMI